MKSPQGKPILRKQKTEPDVFKEPENLRSAPEARYTTFGMHLRRVSAKCLLVAVLALPLLGHAADDAAKASNSVTTAAATTAPATTNAAAAAAAPAPQQPDSVAYP